MHLIHANLYWSGYLHSNFISYEQLKVHMYICAVKGAHVHMVHMYICAVKGAHVRMYQLTGISKPHEVSVAIFFSGKYISSN